MTRPENDEITRLLTRAGDGDKVAAEALLPQMYEALYRLARRQMAQEKPGQTLQATALVHEAYLRLVGEQDPGWSGRRHFYGAAAEAMRRILIERARRYRRLKHGAGRRRVDLDDMDPAAADESNSDDVLALDSALKALSEHDERAAEIVKLRYFAGLSNAEAAAVLDVSERTIRRDWNYARLWLLEYMSDGEASEPTETTDA